MEKDRIAAILNDSPAIFEVAENPKASPHHYGYHNFGQEAVERNERSIQTYAARYGVDADLLRAIMYVENARGQFKDRVKKALENLHIGEGPRSALPMNINQRIFGPIMGEGLDFEDPDINIHASAIALARIAARLQNPTPAKIASIWNFSGRERVSDFGATVAQAYAEKPWSAPRDWTQTKIPWADK
ncbi:MAG: hypothetical protein HQ495_07615 [Alphaproteobacteria bacterium]|nr:hypothetical protein [Alphaproteobacteria bacterium]